MNALTARLNALIGPNAGLIKNLAAPIFIVIVLPLFIGIWMVRREKGKAARVE